MSKFIDMTPTWKAAAMIYVAAIQNGTPEGVKAGIAGINEMAAACDSLNEKITAMNNERLATVTQQNIGDILVTAFEGGSNYWISKLDGHKYWSDSELDTLIEHDDGLAFVIDDDGERHKLTADIVRDGIIKAAAHFEKSLDSFIYNHDANDADCALQFALFGEIIYG